jgi:hypothetical protein
VDPLFCSGLICGIIKSKPYIQLNYIPSLTSLQSQLGKLWTWKICMTCSSSPVRLSPIVHMQICYAFDSLHVRCKMHKAFALPHLQPIMQNASLGPCDFPVPSCSLISLYRAFEHRRWRQPTHRCAVVQVARWPSSPRADGEAATLTRICCLLTLIGHHRYRRSSLPSPCEH